MQGTSEHYDQDVVFYIVGISGTCNEADDAILPILYFFYLKEV